MALRAAARLRPRQQRQQPLLTLPHLRQQLQLRRHSRLQLRPRLQLLTRLHQHQQLLTRRQLHLQLLLRRHLLPHRDRPRRQEVRLRPGLARLRRRGRRPWGLVIAIDESVGPRSRHLGSTGCQPVVVGSLPTNHESPTVLQGHLGSKRSRSFSARLPKRTGWQPVLPRAPIYLGARLKPCRFTFR